MPEVSTIADAENAVRARAVAAIRVFIFLTRIIHEKAAEVA
jgi:hypothetical protein